MTLHALTSLHDERDGTAHRFVLEVVQELEHVHRLADLAQRREARLHVGQHSQPTSRDKGMHYCTMEPLSSMLRVQRTRVCSLRSS